MKTLLALVIVLAVMPNIANATKVETETNGHEVVAHVRRQFPAISNRGAIRTRRSSLPFR